MSPESDAPAVTDPLAPSTAPSPGTLIREARERMNLSLDQLAGMTKLSYTVLEALERDVDAVLEPVYVRGYYRKCAKVLEIPEAQLLQAYESRVAPKTPVPPAKLRLASGSDFGSGARLPIPRAIVAALLAILICAALWVARSQSARTPAVAEAVVEAPAEVPAATPSAVTPPLVATTPEVPAAPAATPAPVAPVPASAGSTGADPHPAVSPAPTASATPGGATSGSAPASATADTSGNLAGASAGLTLRFKGTSWARVTDANGKVLYDGLAEAGQSQSLSGEGPLSLFIGNATAVQVEFQGAAVDLAPYTRSNKTARLTLPATS